jgi:hypothetical protein
MTNEFKSKYHSDISRSSKYVSRELEAKALLLRNLSKLNITVTEGSQEFVGKVGILEGHPEIRFDYSLWYYDKLLLGFIEVTGDNEDDEYIYILSEKVNKARYSTAPVWFLYFKDKFRKRLVIRAQFIQRYGQLVKWIEGEKPYYRVHLNHCQSFKSWVSWLRELLLYVQQGFWNEMRLKLIQW